MAKYQKSPMTTTAVSELGMRVYHGVAIAGQDGDCVQGAVFSQDVEAAVTLSSRAFQFAMDSKGSERCVLIDEGKFAALLVLAGLSEVAA